MDKIEKEIMELQKAVQMQIVENLKFIDEQGYRYLTNIRRGSQLPFDMAKDCGYVQPIFIIKPALYTKHPGYHYGGIYLDPIVTMNRAWLQDRYESVWVREGLSEAIL